MTPARSPFQRIDTYDCRVRAPSNFRSLRWDKAPRYLLHDRHRIFGREFVEQVKAMGVKQVLSARDPRGKGPTIVVGERSLHRTPTAYASYFHNWELRLKAESRSCLVGHFPFGRKSAKSLGDSRTLTLIAFPSCRARQGCKTNRNSSDHPPH
jgi:hypothetical protein